MSQLLLHNLPPSEPVVFFHNHIVLPISFTQSSFNKELMKGGGFEMGETVSSQSSAVISSCTRGRAILFVCDRAASFHAVGG